MIKIREIEKRDNTIIASIIRKSLEDHGLARPGTVYTDSSTDHLYELFQATGSIYFIAEENDVLLGGCGIYPTRGLPEGYVELVKLYLREEARGKHLGKKLMTKSLDWARSHGYLHVYLETMEELSSAVGLYRKLGFSTLNTPMGDSGHHACQIWMQKKLEQLKVESFKNDSSLYQKSLQIREKVFIEEQNISRELEIEDEEESIFFLLSLNDVPVSTGRLRETEGKIKFERIATLMDFRGRDFGKNLMQELESFALKNYPNKKPWMHAQLSAATFYEAMGWVRAGEIFDEAGIPHVSMTKLL